GPGGGGPGGPAPPGCGASPSTSGPTTGPIRSGDDRPAPRCGGREGGVTGGREGHARVAGVEAPGVAGGGGQPAGGSGRGAGAQVPARPDCDCVPGAAALAAHHQVDRRARRDGDGGQRPRQGVDEGGDDGSNMAGTGEAGAARCVADLLLVDPAL